ncbi:unnamed protein product, partial [Scytosiphon promiscuus]
CHFVKVYLVKGVVVGLGAQLLHRQRERVCLSNVSSFGRLTRHTAHDTREQNVMAWWRPENPASIVWVGLCLPGLMCCLPSLLQYLNRYPKVDGSTIMRLIPEGLDGIVRLDARVEVVADGFDFTEGPSWVHEKDVREIFCPCSFSS